MGDRDKGGGDPPYVRLKASYFEWRDIKLQFNQTDLGAMTTYYAQHEDGIFVELGEQELEPGPTAVPKFAIMPAKIALDALEMQLTLWEVYKRLCEDE